MNKKVIYGIIIILVIVMFTIIWKNSQKEEINGGEENQNTVTEVKTEETIKRDTPAAINEDLNNINIDSGIDEDLKNLDSDVKTL